MKLFMDVIGWAGAIAVVWAYGSVSSGRIEAQSLRYQVANLVGAAALVVNTIYHAAYPSTAVNGVWGLVAFVAIWRLIAQKKKVTQQ